MLKSVTDYRELGRLESSPYSARIQALFKTYGNNHRFTDFWIQNRDTAVCRIDGNLTIECGENTDYDELKQFLNYISFRTVLLDERCCEKLGKKPDLSSVTVKYNGVVGAEKPVSDDNYKGVYSLLLSCGFELGLYGDYLADFVSRVNSGCAQLTTAYENGAVVASASALFIGSNAVLLGAVAAAKENRGKGYASRLVSSLASFYAKEKNVYLFCREDSLLNFYNKCGFCATGRWAQINNE
ncbi:MAG: GNAT family N-acetyltransferase [Clostridia bacterium]|nr:GNAT family N-acetyltransferase [Clostridia bacterium]